MIFLYANSNVTFIGNNIENVQSEIYGGIDTLFL